MDAFYEWPDFQLAININFFERVFRIYDCDQFTSEFFEYMEQPLNLPE